MRAFIIISSIVALAACTKARKCECYDAKYDKKETFFINGSKKDAKNVCINMADSTETCTLILEK